MFRSLTGNDKLTVVQRCFNWPDDWFTWERIVQRGCPCRDAENRDRENWEHIVTWTTRLRQLTGVRRSTVYGFAANGTAHAQNHGDQNHHENNAKISVYNRGMPTRVPLQGYYKGVEQRALYFSRSLSRVTFHANYINLNCFKISPLCLVAPFWSLKSRLIASWPENRDGFLFPPDRELKYFNREWQRSRILHMIFSIKRIWNLIWFQVEAFCKCRWSVDKIFRDFSRDWWGIFFWLI